MSTYKEFKQQAKRRRAKRTAGRIFLVIVILLLIFAACYVAISIWTGSFLFFDKPNSQASLPPVSQTVSQPPPTAEPTPQPVQAVEVGVQNWNVPTLLPPTVYVDEIPAMDYRIHALPKNGRVSEEYFKTAMFIGDSLTQGIEQLNSGLNGGKTTVCAYRGAGPRSITDNSLVKNVKGVKVNPHDEIFAQQPDNIYILFGTNSIVSMSDEGLIKQYEDLLNLLKERFDPRTKFYVQGIPPVTAQTASERPKMNNDRIRGLNNTIAIMAYNRGMYFVDLQEMIADEQGNLPLEFAASDGYHFNDNGYKRWVDYLSTHTVYSPMHLQHYTDMPSAL